MIHSHFDRLHNVPVVTSCALIRDNNPSSRFAKDNVEVSHIIRQSFLTIKEMLYILGLYDCEELRKKLSLIGLQRLQSQNKEIIDCRAFIPNSPLAALDA